jgi:uncharacterized protein YjbK
LQCLFEIIICSTHTYFFASFIEANLLRNHIGECKLEIEIEFKNTLNKEQFERLLTFYNVEPTQIKRQVNYYFDTDTWALKNKKSALRVRQIDRYYECTIKEATSTNTSFETTDILSEVQAANLIEHLNFPQGTVHSRLNELQIPTGSLVLFGKLTTDRVEIPFKGGLLVFDHSFYLQQDDYEVEYETNDERKGLGIFEEFLNLHHIPKQDAPKKIARFMNALQQKG